MGLVSRREKPNIEEISNTTASYVEGTEADNIQSLNPPTQKTFQPDIYGFIISSIEGIAQAPIKSLKDRVSEYKKECKRLQEKYEETLKETNNLKGQFTSLEKYAIGIVGFVLVQFLVILGVFFGYINPILNNLKKQTEETTPKVEHIKSPPNPPQIPKK